MAQTPVQMQSTDVIDPARIAALNVTLGINGTAPHPFAHQVLFWDAHPAENLGQDGHPKTGGLIPNFGLPRRMWAGGRLNFFAPLQIGDPITRVTTRLRADHKQGRTGTLAVITLKHVLSQNGACVVEDEQDLIYREAAAHDAPPPAPIAAPTDETMSETRGFTTTQLFRYSALTFNGHRIHYDRDYARNVEGYPGLVVHGPLLAQYLMLLAERELGQLKTFSFRATAPLFDDETAAFCAKSSGNGLDMWVRAEDGRLCMSATAQ
ncbi:MaoC family dehydratase N-terminal domain-containing protein [Litoreibacter sp.]|nr:MaoC family dehydratase N-terminal domain-containing protein [Litoreibacter sp.]